MADDAQDVGLTAVVVDRIAQRLAVDGQCLIVGVLPVPALQGAAERVRVDAGQHLAHDGAAGHLVATVAVTTAKPCPRLLAQVLRPQADGLIATPPTEDSAGGDGQHRGQRVAPNTRIAKPFGRRST